MTSVGSTTLAFKDKKGQQFGRELRKQFLFDEKHINLNHGSFGTYPRVVQTALRSFQDQAEARPDSFIRYEYPKILDEARNAMSRLLNAPTAELVFVPNATTGVNTVLRNIVFSPGDHILYFDTIYGACEKTIAYICETTPASAVKIQYTFPVEDDWLLSEFEKKVEEVEAKGGKVKIAVFDTVVSMPGVRMPFERLVRSCKRLGVLSLVDGAHGVGHVELDLGKLDADFFVSNCHKWLHVPRGCAIFHVPMRNQPLMRSTLPTSHGFVLIPVPGAAPATNPLPPSSVPKSAFETGFEFVGTIDNGPYLCIPTAIQWRESIGGEAVIREYCWTLAKEGTKKVADILGTDILDNRTETMTRCCMTNVRLPLDVAKLQALGVKTGIAKDDVGIVVRNWISKLLIDDYETFIAIMFYGGQWWARLSAQVYLEMADFEWAGKTLKDVCNRVTEGEWAAIQSKL